MVLGAINGVPEAWCKLLLLFTVPSWLLLQFPISLPLRFISQHVTIVLGAISEVLERPGRGGVMWLVA